MQAPCILKINVLLIIFSLIAACGSSSESPENNVAIEFISPIQGANIGLGEATRITLTVRLNSQDDSADLAQVNAVTTNGGVSLSQSATNPDFWLAEVAVSPGENQISLEVSGDQLRGNNQISFKNELAFSWGEGILLDEENNRLILSSYRMSDLLSFDLSTGKGRAITQTAFTGNSSGAFWSGDWAVKGRSVYISDRIENIIYQLDLTTGERFVISSQSQGSGPMFSGIYDIFHDRENGRLLACDGNADAIFSIDLNTGERSIISQNGNVGTGDDFSRIYAIEYDSDSNQIFVADRDAPAVFKVDADTGYRQIIASPEVGSGPEPSWVYDVLPDLANNRVLFTSYDFSNEIETAGILSINLFTLERTYLSSNSTQNDLPLVNPNSLTRKSSDNQVFVSDRETGIIYKVDINTGTREIALKAEVSRGDDFNLTPQKLALSPDGKRLLAQNKGNIYNIDLANGERRIIASNSIGEGISIEGFTNLAVDWESDAAYVVSPSVSEQAAIVKIDLSSGQRTQISEDDSLDAPSELTFDNVNKLIYLIDTHTNEDTGLTQPTIFSLDTTSGATHTLLTANSEYEPRNIELAWNGNTLYSYGSDEIDFTPLFSAINTTSGEFDFNLDTPPMTNSLDQEMLFNRYRYFFVDTANRRLLASYRREEPLYPQTAVAAIPLDGSAPGILSDASTGNGLPILGTTDIVFDTATNRVFIADIYYGGIIMVSLTSGDRMLISQ